MSGNTTSLIAAIKAKQYQEIERILTQDQPPNPMLKNLGKSPINIAAEENDLQAIRIIIRHSKILNDKKGQDAVLAALKAIFSQVSIWNGYKADNYKEIIDLLNDISLASSVGKNHFLVMSVINLFPYGPVDQDESFNNPSDKIWKKIFSMVTVDANESLIHQMLFYASQHDENVDVIRAALNLFETSPKSREELFKYTGMNLWGHQWSEPIKEFLLYNKAPDIELKPEVCKNIFKNAWPPEVTNAGDLDQLINIMLSTKKPKLLYSIIRALSEEQAKSIMTYSDLYSVALGSDAWQRLYDVTPYKASLIANMIDLGMHHEDDILIDNAIILFKNNQALKAKPDQSFNDFYKNSFSVDMWMRILRLQKEDAPYNVDDFRHELNMAERHRNLVLYIAILKLILENQEPQLMAKYIITVPNFNEIRLILAYLSTLGPDFKKDPLWGVLEQVLNVPETDREKINSVVAILEISRDFPINLEVMLAAQNLFGLTEKIEKLGKSEKKFNPVLLQILPISKPPSDIFRYYLENYDSYVNLLNPQKDVASKDQINLLKYMLRHYKQLKNVANYSKVVEKLIDEDVFRNINVEFIHDILAYNYHYYQLFGISNIPPVVLEKIFKPMGFNLYENPDFQTILEQNNFVTALEFDTLKNDNPLHCMLAAELQANLNLPTSELISAAQTAHDLEAAANFDAFSQRYIETNPETIISEEEQLAFIRLFTLYRLYLVNPNHALVLKLIESPKIKELFNLPKEDDFLEFYKNYKSMPAKEPLLEYAINNSEQSNISINDMDAIDQAIVAGDANYYAEQTLLALRSVREAPILTSENEASRSQFLMNDELRSGTANLIQYLYSDIGYPRDKFKSHNDILKILLRFAFVDKKGTPSIERAELFKLYNDNKNKVFSYEIYSQKLEEIFVERLKHNKEVFCIQVADAATAYVKEGQEPSASLQSCIEGYKSRLNQLLDGDILYGRTPTKLQLMQGFLVELLQGNLEKRLESIENYDEKRNFLGRFLSTRVANAAFLAAGKAEEMSVAFGNSDNIDPAQLYELIDVTHELEVQDDKMRALLLTVSKLFEESDTFNPDKEQLRKKNVEWEAFFALLQMGGGEVVMKKLDAFFRPKYGNKDKKYNEGESIVTDVNLQEKILDQAGSIENMILDDKIIPARKIAQVKSKISQLVPMIIEYTSGKFEEGNAEDDKQFDKIKAELVAFVYPSEGHKSLAVGDFKQEIEMLLVEGIEAEDSKKAEIETKKRRLH